MLQIVFFLNKYKNCKFIKFNAILCLTHHHSSITWVASLEVWADSLQHWVPLDLGMTHVEPLVLVVLVNLQVVELVYFLVY